MHIMPEQNAMYIRWPTLRAPRFCATSYVTVYSVASGSPHDAANICHIPLESCQSMIFRGSQWELVA